MVSDTVLVGVLTGGFTLAASAVAARYNRLNTKDRIEIESRRRRAEIYAGQKVEALSELHAALTDCRLKIGRELTGDGPRLSEEEVARLWPLIDRLQTAQDKARIFLTTDEQEQAVQDAVMEIIRAAQFIDGVAKSEDDLVPVDEEELSEETEKAKRVLEEEMSGPIKKFESDE